MALIDKLTEMHNKAHKYEDIDRDLYKNKWKEDLNILFQDIAYNWLIEYEREGLLKTTFILEIKLDYFIGEYITAVLDIELPNKYFIALEPVSAVSEHDDGHIMLYLRGDRSKKVDIYRILKSNTNNSDHFSNVRWETTGVNFKRSDSKLVEFNKNELEKIIDTWLQF